MSEQQQPVEGFPIDMPVQLKITPTSQSSSHSNGSLGTVFIILAVILVISLLSCVIGRICNKRRHGDHHPTEKSHDIHPRGRDDHDMEFGIDKRMPTSEVAASNGDHHPTEKSHDIHPRGRDGPEMEFGIDKRMPTPEVAAPNGDHSNIPTSSTSFDNRHHGKEGVRFAEDH